MTLHSCASRPWSSCSSRSSCRTRASACARWWASSNCGMIALVGWATEAERLSEIAARGPRSAAELRLLRTWFSLDPPRALLERAFRDAGLPIPERPPVRAVFYAGEVAHPGPQLTVREAHELLGFVAHRARAFLEAYQSAATQVGPVLSVVAVERPPARGGRDAALLSAARFAQEIARSAP